MRVKELANKLDITPETVRYYTRIGYLGSTPFFRTLQRSPIVGKRSFCVEARTVQRGVQAGRC